MIPLVVYALYQTQVAYHLTPAGRLQLQVLIFALQLRWSVFLLTNWISASVN